MLKKAFILPIAFLVGLVLASMVKDVAAQIMQLSDGTYGHKIVIYRLDGTAVTDFGGGGSANCAELAADHSDETGTCGGVVLSNSPTFVDDFDLAAAGVRVSAADGVLTLLGLGDGNDENLTIDFDNAAANTITVASGTGVTQVTWNGFVMSMTPPAGGESIALRTNNSSGSARLQFGILSTAPNYGALWAGPLTPTATNYAFSSDGTDLVLNAGGAAGLLQLRSNNSVELQATVDIVTITGRLGLSTRQSVTVDGDTTFAITSSYVLLACTGAETINTITGGSTGVELVLEHTDTDCTIADDDDPTAANAVDLTGAATNDAGAVNKIITLRYNGTYWLQVSESDN
jgi:hypothetical protein